MEYPAKTMHKNRTNLVKKKNPDSLIPSPPPSKTTKKANAKKTKNHTQSVSNLKKKPKSVVESLSKKLKIKGKKKKPNLDAFYCKAFDRKATSPKLRKLKAKERKLLAHSDTPVIDLTAEDSGNETEPMGDGNETENEVEKTEIMGDLDMSYQTLFAPEETDSPVRVITTDPTLTYEDLSFESLFPELCTNKNKNDYDIENYDCLF